MDEKVKDIFNKFSLSYSDGPEKTASDSDIIKQAEDVNKKLNDVLNTTKNASSLSLEELMILETV